MKNFSDNNEDSSSIFQGKIREQDFSAKQKLNELKAAIEELDRQDLLRRLECERQASNCVDEISSQAELYTKRGDEGYFDCERPLWSFFESLFNLFEVNVDDPKIYQMLKEKKEEKLIAAIIKFLRDKLKELIKKIFKSNLDLSWDKRLDKEIKELKEKLGSGELSEEEFARVLERLTALQDLKFRLQLAVTGWIITMFAGMFGVELAAIVEASTEKEDKKAEKTSLKEENKEVCGNVEIKMDERKKPKVPVSLFEVSPGFVRPVVLNKSERDLLPKPMKELMPKEVIKEEIREVKEAKPKVEEEKKAKPEEPKKEVCPSKPTEKKLTGNGPGVQANYSRSFNGKEERDKDNTIDDVNNKEVPTTKSANKQKMDDFCAELTTMVIDHWQAPSGTTDNGKSSADQRSSASSVQEDPRSKVTDVLNERAARGNGNTPSR
ncbi:hypothetical protein [Wolbachia pipientis]|uniref:hypothetical protein n=1 Tax=Wolbachia pipientis TaxID=955 RepID=UPI001FD0D4A3|nr:hypothetical protein [Wolbachia pipientis]